ncbi:MAG: sugar ABC transporter substrate-binding protein [Lachnospiraceae bacterium]|nr:sugar ABC transporter substrate-binding protein [Lachnospiraceae bacterium]
MKKNALQKTLALTLTGAMAMSALAGCGSSDTADTSSTTSTDTKTESSATTDKAADSSASTTTSTDTAAADTPAVAGIEGWTAFADEVTIKIPVYDRGAEGVPDVSNNYWTQWINTEFGDKYNINVEFVGITRSDVLTDYALLAADQNLPTILMEYDYPKLAQWASDGYLTTYDIDAFAQVAPTYYNRMVELGQIGYTEMNGDCYFALAERPYYDTNYTWVTWYRQDWLEQVGYSEWPATWAEQKEILLKIKEAGICEYPLGGAMVTGAGVDQNYAYRSFPLDEQNWATYGDYAIPALGDEANKKLLQRVNEQYNLGLIDPEYYVTDNATAEANFINGKAFQWSGYISGNMQVLSSFYDTNPDADLNVMVAANVSDPDGGTVPAFRANNPFGMMIGFSSMASEDEIKAAWMYMEWCTQEENLFTYQWGIEGEHFNYDENGLPVSVGDYAGDKKQGYNNSKDYWCVTVEARTAGTIEDVIKASSPQGLPEDFTQDIIDNYYGQKAIAEAGYAVSDCNFAVVIETTSEYQATLLEKYTEYRDALTMCDPADFETLYAQYAQEYADAGYQAIVDERLEAYNAGQSTKLPK